VPKTLIILPRAEADVDAHALYYQTHDSPAVASRFLDDLRHAFERVLGFPNVGKLWPTTSRELQGLRRWPLPHFPYSIFYLPSETTIEIVRVLHNSRDLPPLLEDQ